MLNVFEVPLRVLDQILHLILVLDLQLLDRVIQRYYLLGLFLRFHPQLLHLLLQIVLVCCELIDLFVKIFLYIDKLLFGVFMLMYLMPSLVLHYGKLDLELLLLLVKLHCCLLLDGLKLQIQFLFSLLDQLLFLDFEGLL